jgi:hypothetical protein
LNISLLSGFRWAQTAFLKELSGWDLAPPETADRRAAADYCGSHAAWPSQESTTVVDQLAIVCVTNVTGRSIPGDAPHGVDVRDP